MIIPGSVNGATLLFVPLLTVGQTSRDIPARDRGGSFEWGLRKDVEVYDGNMEEDRGVAKQRGYLN